MFYPQSILILFRKELSRRLQPRVSLRTFGRGLVEGRVASPLRQGGNDILHSRFKVERKLQMLTTELKGGEGKLLAVTLHLNQILK